MARLERFLGAIARALEKFGGKVSWHAHGEYLSRILGISWFSAFVLSADEETVAYDGCKGLSESAEVQYKKKQHGVVKSLC